jgi:hypothetical protein
VKIRLLLFRVFLFALLSRSALAAVFYVDVNGANPTPPYAGWSTAATNIQDAIDASTDSDLILVTNGVYETGGQVVYGSLTNRVVINKAITVQSVNGPASTIIQGYQDTNTVVGDDAVRCVYLTNNAVLSGFTLTNGATRAYFEENLEYSGGGAWCESTNAIITNCVLTANSAYFTGGGVFSGTLVDCTLTNNGATRGGGAESSTLNNCMLIGNQAGIGGGADSSMLNNCGLANNNASESGGGAIYSTLNDCGLTGNSAFQGGGVASCTLTNCPLADNTAFYSGGADSSTLNNCTLTGNSAYFGGGVFSGTLTNCTLTGNSGFYGGGAGGSTLVNCVLANNSAEFNGGGAEGCGLNNCTLTGNTALSGGGADSSALNNCALAGNAALYQGGAAENCTVNNCTLVFNSATVTGGGADSSVMNNCIDYFNSAPGGANYSGSTLNFCCTTPLPSSGTNNITADPQLADTAHISASSPCIDAGSTNYSTGVDLDGEPWLNPPSIGCNEYDAGTASGPLSVAVQADYTNVAPGFVVTFAGLIYGHAADSF